MSICPSREVRVSPVMTKRAFCSTGSRKVTESSLSFTTQSATIAPSTWLMVTRSGIWIFASCAAP